MPCEPCHLAYAGGVKKKTRLRAEAAKSQTAAGQQQAPKTAVSANHFKPTPKVPLSVDSAKAHIAKEEEAKKQAMAAAASEEKLATPFGFDALKKAWEIYAQTAEIQESPMLSTIMSVCPYQLEDPFKVRVFLQNALQQAQLPKLLPGLGKHLRQTLRNDQIEITAEVRAMEAQAIAQTQKLYTDDDKLRYLEESYPALRQLRERLGLALM